MPCRPAALAGEAPEIGGRLSWSGAYHCWHNATSPRIFDNSWVLNNMVSTSRILHTGSGTLALSRYLTVLPGKKQSHLFAKVGSEASATPFDRVMEFRGCDQWLSKRGEEPCFEAGPLRNDVFVDDINVARNAAFFTSEDKVYALGGEHSRLCGEEPGDPCGNGAELWARTKGDDNWSFKSIVIKGDHPGCLELRRGFTQCEFDGKWSVAKIGDGWLVYGRANLSKRHGGRWTTVATISQREIDTAIAENRPPIVRPFKNVSFGEGSAQTQKYFSSLSQARSPELNLYFFAVNTNPVDPRTLLAIFPVSTRAHAYLATSVSRDGLKWSPPVPLFDSQMSLKGNGKMRGLDHPVDGLFVKKGVVYVYTQINVGGIVPEGSSFDAYPPHLVAHAIPLENLARYTKQALHSMRAS